MQNMDRVAYLTPGESGYSVVQSDLGVITVSLKDIQPYANGSKITLRLGNTTSATINGAQATLDWGSADSAGLPAGAEKSREVTFAESLPAGAWTDCKIVLEGVPPVQLGYVRVREMKHSGIRLRS